MKKVGSAFENFAFKAFDFSGRATLLEYWLIMPLVWLAILFLAYGDLMEFWGFLLQRQVPPLNPLYWDAIVVFVLTIIPRLSLTVRRLHDSGKSGKWAKLPYLTFFFSLYLVLGLLSAVATVGISSGFSSEPQSEMAAFGILMLIFMGNLESLWDLAFSAAGVLNAMGWDAVWAALAGMTDSAPTVSGAQALSNLNDGLQSDPIGGSTVMLVMGFMIAAPFVTFFLHIFFMMSPSKPDYELDNTGPIAGASLRKQGEISDNPFAGYKYLYDRSPEQEEARKIADKEQVRSLYQQRVLGRQPT